MDSVSASVDERTSLSRSQCKRCGKFFAVKFDFNVGIFEGINLLSSAVERSFWERGD